MSFQNAFGGERSGYSRGPYNFLPATAPRPYESGTNLDKIQNDLLTTVFVSRIPVELDDDQVSELMNTCGPVKNWKRVFNVDGTPSHFGFCIFESEVGVIRALRSISPERPPEYEWTEQDPKFPFLLMADVATKNNIRNHPEFQVNERDQQVLNKLKQIFKDLVADYNTTGVKETTPPQEHNGMKGYDHVVAGGERGVGGDGMDVDTREEMMERERAEKKELERQHAFKEKERRFEQQEGARIRRYQADVEADRDHEEKKSKARVFQETFYADYDDDKEADMDADEYYRDRDHWWSKRQAHRAREREFDIRDRRMEAEEIEAELAKEREMVARLQREKEARELEELQQLELSVPGTAIEIGPEDQVAPSDIQVTRIMTKEERMAAMRDLVASIPSGREGLWAWDVKWDYLDSNIISKKLEPFLKKKVMEHIGDESNDLVAFILEKIGKHGDIQSIYDELSPVLVEETEVFCLKLWRMVIYETESRSAGL